MPFNFDDYYIDNDDSGDDYDGLDLEGFLEAYEGEYVGEWRPHVQQIDMLVKALVKERLNGFISAVKAQLEDDTDEQSGADNTGSTPQYTGGPSTVQGQLDERYANAQSGWVPLSETLTYVDANTVSVATGAASRFKIGDKLKVTDSGTLYGRIGSITDTQLGIAWYSGGLSGGAITDVKLSRVESPLGFQQPVIAFPYSGSLANYNHGLGIVENAVRFTANEVAISISACYSLAATDSLTNGMTIGTLPSYIPKPRTKLIFACRLQKADSTTITNGLVEIATTGVITLYQSSSPQNYYAFYFNINYAI